MSADTVAAIAEVERLLKVALLAESAARASASVTANAIVGRRYAGSSRRTRPSASSVRT
jgi:hypothetical protein